MSLLSRLRPFQTFSKRYMTTLPKLQSPTYIASLYAAYQQDPNSIDQSWTEYFKEIERQPVQAAGNTSASNADAGEAAAKEGGMMMLLGRPEYTEQIKVQLLVRAYQVRGHQLADLDPLNLHVKGNPPELDPKTYGFDENDLKRNFVIGGGLLTGFAEKGAKTEMKLEDIISNLKKTYCSHIGVEYHHIPSREQCDWIRAKLEVPQPFKYSQKEKRMILDRLIWSDSFERFIASKWSSEKRFGLEGCEALIPGMKALIDRSVDLGVENITIGMPHRGRLNVLSNVVRKPNESIFSEFAGTKYGSGEEGSGDVKYHLGANYDRPTPSGKRVNLSLVANPSHLEAVNPVVEGKTRAIQFYKNDEAKRDKAMSVLLHGDAAFAAQGVVYETLGFADLPNYATGGTVHLIVNNQIGFTTDPRFARSTPYCTDVAKTINAPIIHVNADDVESVNFACEFAAEWRKEYKKPIVIDLVCYRRYGHNEVDQPSFTQPRMYKTIAKKQPVLEIYTAQLIKEGSFTKEEIEANKAHVWDVLEKAYAASKDYKSQPVEWVSSVWEGFKSPKELASTVTKIQPTGVATSKLHSIGEKVTTYPSNLNVHPLLAKIYKQRNKTVKEGKGLDWATAESLAFATLLEEGIHCRLSGQDVERGTFSQRHSVLNDQKDESTYIPVNHVSPDQAKMHICNSSLSEFGTLGFELGYSLVNPNSLVMWEAQFGDFANNAQCIIDQFICSGEAKWLQRSGLTMLLPHGYDGAGPEHSSARIERFLALCDDNPFEMPVLGEQNRQLQDCNMQVLYPSTPANYFHALRRQVHREFRKPLILMASKSLLRHPLAQSSFEEMEEGTLFKPLLPDTIHLDEQVPSVKRLVFCSGQVYYALHKARAANQLDSEVAIMRVEQFSPFPYTEFRAEVGRYPNAHEVVWAQEEPLNFGGWAYVNPRIETVLKETPGPCQNTRASVASRDPNCAVAVGSKKLHKKEEERLASQALFGRELPVKEVQAGVPVFQQ